MACASGIPILVGATVLLDLFSSYQVSMPSMPQGGSRASSACFIFFRALCSSIDALHTRVPLFLYGSRDTPAFGSICYLNGIFSIDGLMSDDNDDVYLFIGNSDVGTFKLVYGSQVRVMRYSTATAKGLGQNNKNSQSIWETLHSKYSRVDLSAIVWVFGSVDAKFSYYFKLCHEWDGRETDRPDPYKLMEECAVKYVQFVKKVHDEFLLPKQTNAKTVVLGAEPNGAVPSLLFEQCVKYFVTPDTPENKRRVMASIAQHHPDSLRLKLNESLKKECL